MKAERVIGLLKEHQYTLSAGESCTGGLFLSTLIDVSGASAVIKEGFITYAEEAKQKHLGVKAETLETYTAVSEQVAKEMAEGLQKRTEADIAISITGLAGPSGGTEKIPVGTVYIGCCYRGETRVEHFLFSGTRTEVREYAVEQALLIVEQCFTKTG